MDHADLVAEMPQVEHLSTQDRLHLARMRRVHQLKVAKQKEKEWQKQQNRRDHHRNSISSKKPRNIKFENSVVLLEAAARNDIEEVDRLLELGVSPDATNEDGLTPLHQCCIDNNADMLRLLLDYGASVNAKDSEKWTPLHAAATCGHLYLVKILISRGANLLAVNVDGNMPYDLCDDEETLDCIEAEMSRRGVTQELIDETRAATENQMLLDLNDIYVRGGDLEYPDKHGASPLHIASANGYTKVVEFLLENHANVDSMDKDFWTPVHAAACWGHMEVLEMLAMSGADLNAKNKNDETPSDICEDAEIRERIEQLKTEQESKRLAEAQRRRVRRSQSNNTRAQSVRRTSLRDKTLTTKKDAAEETRLRLQAQEGYTTTPDTNKTESRTIPGNGKDSPIIPIIINGTNNSTASTSLTTTTTTTITNGHSTSNLNHKNNNNIINNNSNSSVLRYDTIDGKISYANGPNGNTTGNSGSSLYDASLVSRQSPDGKDNESHFSGGGGGGGSGAGQLEAKNRLLMANNNNNSQKLMGNNDIATEIFSASNENGKINVQVTVLVDTHSNLDQSLSGTTLANLKKQRAQSRSSNASDNSIPMSAISSQPSISKDMSIVSTSDLLSPSTGTSGVLSGSGGGGGLGSQQSPSIIKFSGVTSDVVSDSTSRRCCAIM